MSANEVLLPPWIIPQAESTTLIDDSTSVFRAAYAPGNAQRVTYVEPRLQVKQTFQGLRGFERGAMLAALKRAKGKFATVRAICGYKIRGSFPQTEIFLNNDLSNGTTSWSTDANAQYTIAALDRGIRATRAQVTNTSFPILQAVSLLAAVPYSIRAFVNAGKGGASIGVGTDGVGVLAGSSSQGMLAGTFTTPAFSGRAGLFDVSASAVLAGNFFDAKWTSLARCAQVDNGVNLLLNSDTPGSGTGWALAAATVGANGTAGPDGNTDAYQITETTANSSHFIQGSVTVQSAAADYTASIFVNPANRAWCWLQMIETAGSTTVQAFYNPSTNTIGTITTGAGWSNVTVAVQDYGSSWKRLTITARKTSAATTIALQFGPGTANGTSSYIGTTSSVALLTWRASIAQSSVPVAAVGTTSSQALGTSQTGNSINVKGLPASTADLLLEDDLFEINGELKSAISPLSSDGTGLGTLIFAPALCRSPADGDGVIINKPMGKFILAADSNWANDFGVYADSNITLEAINE